MTDPQIRDFIKTLDLSDDAKYSTYEAKILYEYNGCSDSRYSDLFLTKLWNKLSDLPFDQYEPLTLFLTNSIGAKILKHAPRNSDIYSLNGDFNCYIASKAIVQHMEFDWEPKVEFGIIANYFYLDYEKFTGNKYKIVINTFEDDNGYYKSIDNNKAADLPYYQYCLVRGLLFTDDYICSIVPSKHAEELKRFILGDIINYTDKKIFLESIIADADYTAYLLKIN